VIGEYLFNVTVYPICINVYQFKYNERENLFYSKYNVFIIKNIYTVNDNKEYKMN